MRPPVEFTDLGDESFDVSTRDTWLGWLKPSTYGVWVFVDGEYVEYTSDQLRQVANKIEELNGAHDEDGEKQ